MDKWGQKPLLPKVNTQHPLASGLMFCFVPFSKSARFMDLCSGMNGAGTGVINTDAVTGPYGEGYNFAAAPDRVQWDTWARFDFAAAPGFSTSVWVKPSGTAAGILNKKGTAAGSDGWTVRQSTTQFQYRHENTTINQTGTYSTGLWYNLVTTWDGTTGFMYLNGALSNSGALGAPTSTGKPLRLGSYSDANAAGAFGSVAGAMIWGRVLTIGEIKALYSDPWAVVRPVPLVRRFSATSVKAPAAPVVSSGRIQYSGDGVYEAAVRRYWGSAIVESL